MQLHALKLKKNKTKQNSLHFKDAIIEIACLIYKLTMTEQWADGVCDRFKFSARTPWQGALNEMESNQFQNSLDSNWVPEDTPFYMVHLVMLK